MVTTPVTQNPEYGWSNLPPEALLEKQRQFAVPPLRWKTSMGVRSFSISQQQTVRFQRLDEITTYANSLRTRDVVPSETRIIDMSYTGGMDNTVSVESSVAVQRPQIEVLHAEIARYEHVDIMWDDELGERPSLTTIRTAQTELIALARLAERERTRWIAPHISATPFGDIAFEWWSDNKQLSIYVSEGEAEYIQTWKDGDSVRMVDGDATSEEKKREFWSWFTA